MGLGSIPLLKDRYGRPVDRLRIIVTSRCNYRCVFCHFEGVTRTSEDVLTPEDYGFIAYVLKDYGIRYHKLTGGEPLLRDDIHTIIASIKHYSDEVSLVTNGSMLTEKAKLLAEAGLDRLNVSLHTLRDDVYDYVTGTSNLLGKVLRGVDKALEYGLKVKLNVVLMRSNIDDLPKVLEYAEQKKLDISLIELIPIGVPREVYSKEYVPISEALKIIEERSISKHVRDFQNRPIYVLRSGIRVEAVIGYGNRYLCNACTRMRLTPDGYLKTCLYAEEHPIRIVEAVKNRDRDRLIKLFREAVLMRKPLFT